MRVGSQLRGGGFSSATVCVRGLNGSAVSASFSLHCVVQSPKLRRCRCGFPHGCVRRSLAQSAVSLPRLPGRKLSGQTDAETGLRDATCGCDYPEALGFEVLNMQAVSRRAFVRR